MILASSTANAVLIDLGNGMIYDTGQDLTWMQNANVKGTMTWSQANAWAQSLVFGGYDDWRLPTTLQYGDSSCTADAGMQYETLVGCTGGEMEHLTAFELYDAGEADKQTSQSSLDYPFRDEPFINIQTGTRYWTGTQHRNDTDFYWQWSFVKSLDNSKLSGPYKTTLRDGNDRYAWAVRDGRATVPVPPSIWLVGTGLAGLLAGRRRRGARGSR